MRFLSWNPQGLGNRRGFQTLRNLLTKEETDVVFLQETKVHASFFSINKFKLRFHNVFAVDYVEKGGNLAML